jgi:hypothetical protein
MVTINPINFQSTNTFSKILARLPRLLAAAKPASYTAHGSIKPCENQEQPTSHLDGEEVGNSALLKRRDELVGQAEPGDGDLVRAPLEQPRPGLAPVLLVVAAEPEPLEGVLGEHRVGRGDGRRHAPPAPPERPAAEGVGERAAGGRVG